MHINVILNNTNLITSDQKIPDNIFSNQKIPKCLFLVKLLNRLSMIASSIGWRICQRPYLLLFLVHISKLIYIKLCCVIFTKLLHVLIYSCSQIVKLYKKLSTNVKNKKTWYQLDGFPQSQSIKIQLNWRH